MNLEAFGNGWKFAAAGDGGQWSLLDTRRGSTIADWLWASLNGISELNCVSEKCRFHSKLDNCEVVVEQENVYPFGGESIIDRSLVLRDKLAEVRLDVKPGRGEIVRKFELETLTFPGEWQQVEIIRQLPEAAGAWHLERLPDNTGVIYSSPQPFALLLLTDSNGFQLEMGIGGDWWRMLGQGNTLWQIEQNAGAVSVKACVVDLPEDAENNRRPWRFNYYLAWGSKKSAQIFADNESEILTVDLLATLNCSCFRAPAVRKYLRKVIRQQQEKTASVILQLPEPEVCDDAGHLERPGKKSLRHWDWDELFALYSWGNRTLGEGRTLTVKLPENSLFGKLPSGRYLGNPPGEASVREL